MLRQARERLQRGGMLDRYKAQRLSAEGERQASARQAQQRLVRDYERLREREAQRLAREQGLCAAWPSPTRSGLRASISGFCGAAPTVRRSPTQTRPRIQRIRWWPRPRQCAIYAAAASCCH